MIRDSQAAILGALLSLTLCATAAGQDLPAAAMGVTWAQTDRAKQDAAETGSGLDEKGATRTNETDHPPGSGIQNRQQLTLQRTAHQVAGDSVTADETAEARQAPDDPFALDAVEAHALARCRSAFPQVARDLGSAGGWLAERGANGFTLCLYGSLASVEIYGMLGSIRGLQVDRLVVKSSGGSLETWLDIAEAIEGKVSSVIVDDACFSACANYAFAVAPERIVPRFSFVAWHGGPTCPSAEGDAKAPPAFIVALAARTEALYARLRLDPSILEMTGRPPSQHQIENVSQAAPLARTVGGYVVSPTDLACFGFRDLERIWHPGDEARVIELSARRSRSMTFLAAPDDWNACRADQPRGLSERSSDAC